MKKFKFNLETVLKYRGMIEEREKNQMAKLNSEMILLENQLTQLREGYRNEVAEFEQATQTGVKVQEILGRQLIIANIEYAIESKLNEIKAHQRLISRQTAVVVKATQDSKTIEKLKEKSLKNYDKEVAKETEKFIEEFVSYKTLRKD